MRKTLIALTLAAITIHYGSAAIDSVKSTMRSHVSAVDSIGARR